MTLQTKKEIIDKSKGLCHDEHLQLFRVLKEHEVGYSENKNGILVNLEKVPNDVIKKLKDIIDLCYSNREANKKRNALYEQARRKVSEYYEHKIQRVSKENEESEEDQDNENEDDDIESKQKDNEDEDIEVYESD